MQRESRSPLFLVIWWMRQENRFHVDFLEIISVRNFSFRREMNARFEIFRKNFFTLFARDGAHTQIHEHVCMSIHSKISSMMIIMTPNKMADWSLPRHLMNEEEESRFYVQTLRNYICTEFWFCWKELTRSIFRKIPFAKMTREKD